MTPTKPSLVDLPQQRESNRPTALVRGSHMHEGHKVPRNRALQARAHPHVNLAALEEHGPVDGGLRDAVARGRAVADDRLCRRAHKHVCAARPLRHLDDPEVVPPRGCALHSGLVYVWPGQYVAGTLSRHGQEHQFMHD